MFKYSSMWVFKLKKGGGLFYLVIVNVIVEDVVIGYL